MRVWICLSNFTQMGVRDIMSYIYFLVCDEEDFILTRIILMQKSSRVFRCVGIPSVVRRDDCDFWCISRALSTTFAPRVPKRPTDNEQFNDKEKVSGCDNIRLHNVQPLLRMLLATEIPVPTYEAARALFLVLERVLH